jgi:release factor glutamine methyltransferase
VSDALDAATARLARAGLPAPRREAAALWAALAGESLGVAWLRADRDVSPAADRAFREAVDLRAAGTPFPYAVGRAGFRTLDLALDARALIPRPETEGLVDLILDWGKRDEGRGQGGLVADIGTGSGCIALSLAVEGQFDRVIAVERSAEAAALARENVARVGPTTPVEVRDGDLLAPLAGERFRVIVSNPPYLTTAEYQALDPSVRQFEPREALESGPDGLAATRALLAGAAALLEPDGMLALEIDERRAAEVRALAQASGWKRIDIHDDIFGRPRYARVFPEGAP